MKLLIVCAVAAFSSVVGRSVEAADVPRPAPQDSRVRLVKYDPRNVTLITVRRGAVTRIVLEADEAIESPVTGLSARCASDEDEWCIHAERGSNQIFVRPKDRATRTNMELRTSKRDYSFEFVVAVDRRVPVDGMFRVVFEYAVPAVKPAEARAAAATTARGVLGLLDSNARLAVEAARISVEAMQAPERMKLEPIAVANSNYTMQVLEGGSDASPSMVFDDGRFTYFEFQGAREVPAIFAYTSDGEGVRANWHMRGPFLVVQRLARKFSLRLGGAVVGIFNEAFDPIGRDTGTSTVSPAVVREGRQ